MIPFNKPYLHGRELVYIANSVASGKISGDGVFTKKVHDFFEKKYQVKKALLTTSCTDALEMAAILLDIGPGDEVIMPAYTFVSTANAFVLRGAKIVFVDSLCDNPNIDHNKIEELITEKTKAIVVVHYAGVSCDMDSILKLSIEYNIPIVEDAAQAIESSYKGRQLGTIGALGAFSFHETKNLISGEGGLLLINDERYAHRAEVIREKGTNRSSFFRGEVDKYGWVDMGSSFLPSDIIAAYLYAQLEIIDNIQARRLEIWHRYWNKLASELPRRGVHIPVIPKYATNNAHMFYLVFGDLALRTKFIEYMKVKKIHSVFHYLSLHSSPFYEDRHDGRSLPQCDRYADGLVRMPLFYELTNEQVDYICDEILNFMKAV